MNDLSQLRAGDLMFTTIPGIGGKAIALGEKLNDKSVTWEVAKKVQHVAIVTQAPTSPFDYMPINIVEAMPGGAIERTWYTMSSDDIWVRPAYHGNQGKAAAAFAHGYRGTPYSWLDYAALTAHHLHFPVPLLDRYITTSKHMICSQLVDQSMADAGFHVFTDGRLAQDVTPAALYVGVLALWGTIIL